MSTFINGGWNNQIKIAAIEYHMENKQFYFQSIILFCLQIQKQFLRNKHKIISKKKKKKKKKEKEKKTKKKKKNQKQNKTLSHVQKTKYKGLKKKKRKKEKC